MPCGRNCWERRNACTRLAHERGKPDAERESGYQERDMAMLRQRMSVIDRRFDPAVDKAEWMLFLGGYLAQPAEMRIGALDEAMGLSPGLSDEELSRKLDEYYDGTTLNSLDTRLALMEATPEDLESNSDPFIRLAVALHETQMAREEASKVRSGRANLLNPQYMRAIINWQQSQGHAAYPDANSTLRVTYGSVMGGSPADGLLYEPFTRLEGILQKDTGEEPFNSPVFAARPDPRGRLRRLLPGFHRLGAGQFPLRPRLHRRQLRLGPRWTPTASWWGCCSTARWRA